MNFEPRLNQLTVDLPIELILSVNKLEKEDVYVSQNVINFFNLSLNDSKLPQNEFFKTKKIIEYLNFIRFNHFPVNQKENPILNSKVCVSNFSLVLLTNVPNHKIIVNQNELSEENWSYHHKIELNDENGQTLARQVFFKLNSISRNSFQVPLCCRSNWISPKSELNQSINLNKKFIIRLNINCKNYDLMLFFYRLLFDKFPNFSKKDFSLFILTQSNQTEQIEFQLSLKSDPSVNVRKIPNSNLIYKIRDRSVFNNVIRLLDGFVEEVEKNKIYSVHDPDQNKIYLIDSSNESFELFKTTGLAQCYFNQLNVIQKKSYMNNFSPSSNTSSSSEANSLDSGNWSCSTISGYNPKTSFKKETNYANSVKNLIYQQQQQQHQTPRRYKKKVASFRTKNSDDEDYDENTEDESDDRELKNLLRKASSSSMYALLAFRNKNLKSKQNQRVSLIDTYERREKNRSHSVLNEPFKPIINQPKLKGVLANNESNLSRKKSKSVTFMDSIGSDDLNKRPKSTTPFIKNEFSSYSRSDFDNYNNKHLEISNDDTFYKNSLIDRKARNTNFLNKPNVGITPETRFRRSHTLDLIRNSKMPLSNTNSQVKQTNENQIDQHTFYKQTNNDYFNKYNVPIAKF